MDLKKLEAAIKKNEKKRDAQNKKIKAAQAKVASEKAVLKGIEDELKPLYALREKLAKFEAEFNASVAELVDDGETAKTTDVANNADDEPADELDEKIEEIVDEEEKDEAEDDVKDDGVKPFGSMF